MAQTTAIDARHWGIAILLGSAIAISYFDRQTPSVAIAAIQRGTAGAREYIASRSWTKPILAAFERVLHGASVAFLRLLSDEWME